MFDRGSYSVQKVERKAFHDADRKVPDRVRRLMTVVQNL